MVARPGDQDTRILSVSHAAHVRWRAERGEIRHRDHVIDHDLIVAWTAEDRRIITGADILGRLLRGISRRADWQFAAAPSRVADPDDA